MTKKLIDRLEELADEMKVIVHQLRVPSTIEAVEDVIEFEGQQYKKVDREACEGDVVRYKNTTSGQFNKDKFYKVLHPITWSEGSCRVIGKDGDDYPLYQKGVGRTSKETDVYELIGEDKPNIQGITIEIDAPKSPNQQRDAIIKKAKKSIVNKLVVRKGQSVYIKRTGKQEWVNVEFVVNEEKRTVVAIARWTKNNEIVARGIAKCMPTDVFNEHIGKAIALGRALGLDVSEFENAVQPDEVVVGMEVVSYQNNDNVIHVQGEVIKIVDGGFKFREEDYRKWIGHDAGWTSEEYGYKIINDSNTEYEVNAQ